MKIFRELKGTSLLEILIVAAILAILSTLAFASYQNVRAKARDAKRKYDIRSVSLALQIYYDDKGKYPKCFCISGEPTEDCWVGDLTYELTEAPEKPYIMPMPEDPLNDPDRDYVYKYCSDNGKEYLIYYKTEEEESLIELRGY